MRDAGPLELPVNHSDIFDDSRHNGRSDHAVLVDVVEFMKNPKRVDGVIPTAIGLHVFDDLNGGWVGASDLLAPLPRERPSIAKDREFGLAKLSNIGSGDRAAMDVSQPMSDVIQRGTQMEKTLRDVETQANWWASDLAAFHKMLSGCSVTLDVDGIDLRFHEPLNLFIESFNAILCVA
jgi:hypothetical protein